MESTADLYHQELVELEHRVYASLRGSTATASSSNSAANGMSAAAPTPLQLDEAEKSVHHANRLLQKLRVQIRTMEDETQRARYVEYMRAHDDSLRELRSQLPKIRREVSSQQRQGTTLNPQQVTLMRPPPFPLGRLSTPNTMAATAADPPQLITHNGRDHGAASEGRATLLGQGRTGGDRLQGEGGAAEDYLEANSGGGGERSPLLQGQALMQSIQRTQESTIHSLRHTERLLCETEAMGGEAARTLRVQTEQILAVNTDLVDMHSESVQAGEELTAFARRMAGDRIIIFLAIAIAVCLILIVILSLVRRLQSEERGSTPGER